jgi:hypothetical protein
MTPGVNEHRQEVRDRYTDVAHTLRDLGRRREAADLIVERYKLFHGTVGELYQAVRDLGKVANAVAHGKTNLTPAEEEERQHYLQMAAQILGDSAGKTPAKSP